MHLSEVDMQLVKKHNSQFVSLKYLSEEGVMQQIDASLSSIESGDACIYTNKINLVPIEGRGFVDPFRSFPTTSFFCENIASGKNYRQLAIKLSKDLKEYSNLILVAELSFWIAEEKLDNAGFAVDLGDKYSNLRSDIVATLEKINIKTNTHFHGKTPSESVVGIRGNDFIELADNIIIAKFIIQNVVDSYGLNVKFSCDSSPNLTLLIQSNKTIIDKIYSAINVKQTAILTDSQRAKNFEIMALQRQEIGTKIALSIRLLCYNHFIPYLSFVELLLS